MKEMSRVAVTGFGIAAALVLSSCSGSGLPDQGSSQGAQSQEGSLQGTSLTMAVMNDPFAGELRRLANEWAEANDVDFQVDIVGYGDLATRVRSDFVGGTANFDLFTMDIVWTGEFAEAGYTVDLASLIERDRQDLDLDDIYDVAWTQGEWKGTQVAYPFAGYVNLLNYRTDVLESSGLSAPTTLEELESNALRIGNSGSVAGWVANGQQGPASAQDWMAYAFQSGGEVLNSEGVPVIDSEVNIRALELYKRLFDNSAPLGATEFDWGQRETSFTQGQAAMVQTWSVSRASYEDSSISNVAGNVGTVPPPMAAGLEPRYAFGGWGLAINADSAAPEAAWEFIKWITSRESMKEMNKNGAGIYIRKSTVEDAELLERYPFLSVVGEALEKGDGDARPRVPQYSEIENAIGIAVSKVLTQGVSPEEALKEAQATVEALM